MARLYAPKKLIEVTVIGQRFIWHPARRLGAKEVWNPGSIAGGSMKSGILRALTLVIISSAIVHAQEPYDKINSHIGALAGFPLSPTNQFVHTGWGAAGGAGYNFNIHHALVFEFMWNRLYATDRAVQPIRQALQSPGFSGKSNLYVVTGNYRYEWRGRTFGAYLIGGAGLYYRTTNPSTLIVTGSGIPCAPAWKWWGFGCSSGTVTPGQSLGSVGSNAFGGNGGGGFTVRVGEDPWRMYVESRYHYAPNKNFSTQLITITVGIRY